MAVVTFFQRYSDSVQPLTFGTCYHDGLLIADVGRSTLAIERLKLLLAGKTVRNIVNYSDLINGDGPYKVKLAN